jgi:hypothetical protein
MSRELAVGLRKGNVFTSSPGEVSFDLDSRVIRGGKIQG